MCSVGCPRLIHGKTITWLADLATLVQRRGLFMAKLSQIGSRLECVPFCGFMGNVSGRLGPLAFTRLMVFTFRSGSREEYPLVRQSRDVSIPLIYGVG